MKVIVGNGSGIVNSDDRPIMIKFTKEEIEHIRSMPGTNDIFVAIPPHWKNHNTKKWSEENRLHINGKTVPAEFYVGHEAEERVDSPHPENNAVNSDQEIIDILNSPDSSVKMQTEALQQISDGEEDAEFVATIAEEVDNGVKNIVSDSDMLQMLGVVR